MSETDDIRKIKKNCSRADYLRAWRKENREHTRLNQRYRYRVDKAYRERTQAYQREYYHQKKAAKTGPETGNTTPPL